MFDTKLRAKLRGGTTHAIALINHPMESGMRKPGDWHKPPPCHHITEIIAEHNGKRVMTAHWGGAIARHPLMEFRFNGGKRGDTVSLRWIDNAGNQRKTSTAIS